MIIPDFVITEFGGLNTAVKDIKTLKPGVSPDALNWVTSKYKDSIELRRGYARLGTTEVTGNGKVTGIGVGVRYDGQQVPFFSYGRKAKYYDATTDDTIEIGTDLLPTTADGKDMWMEPYQNLAGSFMYMGSKFSSAFKVPVANPGSAVDQSINSYRFNVFHVGRGRSFGGQRNGTTPGNKDDTGLYLSYIDKDQLSDYTQVTNETIATATGATTTYAGTLAQRTGARTVMYVSVTDTVETFTDDRNGVLVGSLGGTGTINYATGAVSVTFATAPANGQAITANYYWEDATANGILDFSGGAATQGRVYRQDDGGGNLMAIFNLGIIEYCFHTLKTWQYTGSLADDTSTNLPYRAIGIPYERSAYYTPQGILFADLSRPTDPKFRVLEVMQGTDQNIEPVSISDALDLSPYGFDYCVAFRWGDYEIFCVQEKIMEVANDYNSIIFVRNVVSKVWDRLRYYASNLAVYEGTLISGSSTSNNIYTLFSGFDDDGDAIENYWTSAETDLGTLNLKKCKRMVLSGLIQEAQSYDISLSFDGGAFAKVFTVEGTGDYVDSGIETYIGGATIGSRVIGGGGGTTASPYEIDFPINTDRFKTVRVKIEAMGVGYVSVSQIVFKDIRDKGRKNIPPRTS